MTFNAEVFAATYDAIGPYSGQSDTVKSALKEKLKAAREEAAKSFLSKAEEQAQNDEWLLVKSPKVVKTAKTMAAKAEFNAVITGAVLVGWHIKHEIYVSFYGLSGSNHKADVRALRKHLTINSEKVTFCAEENIIAAHPDVRFLVASAFRLSGNLTTPICACGQSSPKTKCKLTLFTLGIKEIEWS